MEIVAAALYTIHDRRRIQVKASGKLTRPVMSCSVDAIVSANDYAIAEAVVCLLERTPTIGKGAGVFALPALRKGKVLPGPGNACLS